MERIVLLLGLLGGPALLAWIGHHLPKKSARTQAVFWGGVIGQTLGMLTAVVALLAWPVDFDATGALRSAVAHGAMFGGLLLGMGVGALRR